MGNARKKPNVVFVFSDQHRAQSTGFGGNRDVRTPFMNALARESVVFNTAVSGRPIRAAPTGEVCSQVAILRLTACS
jgi:arylsulfatase A-like enzyme